MMRLATLCLLALTACQPKDPTGTLTLKVITENGTKPSLRLKNNPRGESVPIRLDKGSYQFVILYRAGSKLPVELAVECRASINLLPYGKTEGRSVMERGRLPFYEARRINALPSGLYVLDIEATENYCTPDVLIQEN